jgi:hypothetical protein
MSAAAVRSELDGLARDMAPPRHNNLNAAPNRLKGGSSSSSKPSAGPGGSGSGSKGSSPPSPTGRIRARSIANHALGSAAFDVVKEAQQHARGARGAVAAMERYTHYFVRALE